MIKKIQYGLIVLLFGITTSSFGQNGFLSANHSYQTEENNLSLYLYATFSTGNGTCNFIDTCTINISTDTILVNTIYNTAGFYPQVGCADYDTINYNVPDGNYTLIINSNIIFVDEDNNIDTVQVDSQLFPNVTLSINNTFLKRSFKLSPNPAKNILQIEVSDNKEIESIELYNIRGKKVKEFSKNETMLNISEVNAGTYFLKLQTKEGILTKKVLIE